MKRFIPIILALFCASCVNFKYSATAKDGNTETFALNSFGGSQSLESAGGTRYTSNHNKTAGQFFQTVAAVAATLGNAYVGAAGEVTARAKDANAASVTKNASNNATKVQLGAQEVEKANFVPPPEP